MPICVVIFFNWIMFVLIMVSICSHTQGPTAKTGKGSKMKKWQTNFTIAVTLAVVFGLGWALGLAATHLPVRELTLAFQILFSIFVGLQGVLLFLLHGVRNRDIRKLWIDWFTVIGQRSRLASKMWSLSKTSTGTESLQGTRITSGLSTLPRKKEAPSAVENTYVYGQNPISQSLAKSSVAMEMVPDNSNGDLEESKIDLAMAEESIVDKEEHVYDDPC